MTRLSWLNKLLPGRLKGEIRKISDLSEPEQRTMYALMMRYYDHMQYEVFLSDLHKKDDVILMTDETHTIRGFSTLVGLTTDIAGKKVHGIFSGDTIVDKEFWGQRVLGVFFLAYLVAKKLRRPWQPLYWFLISKGYRTYLLMANNFPVHFPRYEKPTPNNRKAIIDGFAQALYPKNYMPEEGVIRFESSCHLRSGVAEIDPPLLQNPRIRFFNEKNAGWPKGDELACLAEMTLWMPLYYYLKSLSKVRGKSTNRRSKRQEHLSTQTANGKVR